MFWKCAANLQENTHVEVALRHGCSLVNLLNIYSTPFPKNTSAWLLLSMYTCVRQKSNQFTFHYETFIRKHQISLDNKFSALTTFSCIYLKSAHSLFWLYIIRSKLIFMLTWYILTVIISLTSINVTGTNDLKVRYILLH